MATVRLGRPKDKGPADTVPVTFRITRELAEEAKAIAKLISTPYVEASPQDAYRAAMERGFRLIRAELAKKGQKP